MRDVLDRLGERVRVNDQGCWEWQGDRTERGYGVAYVRGRTVRAHRYAYGLAHGDVPPLLDHTCHDPRTCPGGPGCRHRACVNPDHLRPSTPASNAGPGRRSARWRGRCARGHDVSDPGAVYVRPNGERECRACRAAARRRSAS